MGFRVHSPVSNLGSPILDTKNRVIRMIKGILAVLIILIGTQVAVGGIAFGGSFSPDGSKIAYVSYETNLEKVYIANMDGNGKGRLTATTDGREYSSHWSPDGTKIAYTSGMVVKVAPVPLELVSAAATPEVSVTPTPEVSVTPTPEVSNTSTPDEVHAPTDGKSTPGFGVIGIGMVLLVHLLMRRLRP